MAFRCMYSRIKTDCWNTKSVVDLARLFHRSHSRIPSSNNLSNIFEPIRASIEIRASTLTKTISSCFFMDSRRTFCCIDTRIFHVSLPPLFHFLLIKVRKPADIPEERLRGHQASDEETLRSKSRLFSLILPCRLPSVEPS